MSQRDVIKVRAHDGIVGLAYLVSITFASQVGLSWTYVAVGVAVLQIASPFTKFCTVYVILEWDEAHPRD